jgi:DNA modification methylase
MGQQAKGTLDDVLDRVTNADALTFARQLPDEAVHCLVTSVPY